MARLAEMAGERDELGRVNDRLRVRVYAGDCDAEATTWPDDARWRPLTEPAPEGEEVEVCVAAWSLKGGRVMIPTLGMLTDGEWDHAAPRGTVYAWRPRQPIPAAPKGES